MKTDMMMRKLPTFTVLSIMALFYSSCQKDKKHPGYEFMPDMYRNAAVKTYRVSDFFHDSVSALVPVAGTIPRGINTYFPFPNTNEGYEAAGATLVNPVPLTDAVLAEGKELFRINCQHCHGEKGDGKGTIKVKGDPFPVPSYFDETRLALKEGHMFFSITYGKNLMGPHASLLTQEERWKVVHYIKQMQKNYLAEKNKTTAGN